MTPEIVQKVIDIVSEESGFSAKQVTLNTTFVELGVDSLDFLAILAEVREKVGPVGDVFVSRIETVSDLAAAVGAEIEAV
jgi:acyl carrier protein